ncbi:MAG: hypothetical protein A2V88_07125 [Elusimicrobia bacterium RBG_16_66_12]|nr:MAG: hypothetical protein A2V88_07125 [Elusimicrobia bacterium RBG_16_66_12]
MPALLIRLLQALYNRAVFFLARLRARFWGLFMKGLGNDVFMMTGVIISSPSGVEIGSDTTIMQYVSMSGEGGLKIGNYVIIASHCRVLTSNHGYEDFNSPICRQKLITGPVVIEDDVWLGSHVVVLPGVTIGRGAIVAANSLVTKDVKPFSVVCGVPARFAKFRFKPEQLAEAAQVRFKS